MSLLVLTTGGTIGAVFNPDPQHPPKYVVLPTDGFDRVRTVLAQDFASVPIRCVSCEPRDSQNIDELYLQNLLPFIRATPEQEILITIGTDGIVAAADFFYAQDLKDKLIVLTGAMVPLANGAESDGYANLAVSLNFLQEKADKRPRQTGGAVFIVLCDYENSEAGIGAWAPRLYDFRPGCYAKLYTQDGRYNRLQRVN